MIKLYKNFWLLLLLVISISAYAVLSMPVAHSAEDKANRRDGQRTLPKVTVTSSKGGGFSFGVLSFHMISGSSHGFNPFRYAHDQSYLELQCLESNDFETCELLCESYPTSYVCELRLGTINVSGSRITPYEPFVRYEIRRGKVVYISAPKDDTEDKRKEKERKELEKKCRRELSHMFDAKVNFPLRAVFSLEQTSREAKEIDAYIDQLFKYTKPIMTTGIQGYNDGKPVDYQNGYEAHNSFYIDQLGNLTRGNNIVFGTRRGQVTPNFKNDTQFRQMIDSPINDLVQRLIIDYHTHPNTEKYYVFPSSADVFKFMLDRRYSFVDKNAMLAIGFISNNVYQILLMSINYNQRLFLQAKEHAFLPRPKTLSEKLAYNKKYGKVLELLFKNSKMIILSSENNEPVDYIEFFKNNAQNQKIGESILIPKSCINLASEKE